MPAPRCSVSPRLAALSRETGISIDVLRTCAGNCEPRSAYRFTVAAFHARGVAAWQQYRRDGVARPIDDVFDGLDARVSARRATLAAICDAKAGTTIRTSLDEL